MPFLWIAAQSVINVKAKQEGDSVVITYNLDYEYPADILLYKSDDFGVSFKKIENNLTGNVGKCIQANSNKMPLEIVWHPLDAIDIVTGDNIIFKVMAIPKYWQFTDARDGKTYNTIRIGDQTWMADNLAYIPKDGKYWTYTREQSNGTDYGCLYNWETAKNVCPDGWHLPDEDEFKTMLESIGGSKQDIYDALIKGGYSGFEGLLGGYYMGKTWGISSVGVDGCFWSSTEYDDIRGRHLEIEKNKNEEENKAEASVWLKVIGMSVRCLSNK